MVSGKRESCHRSAHVSSRTTKVYAHSYGTGEEYSPELGYILLCVGDAGYHCSKRYEPSHLLLPVFSVVRVVMMKTFIVFSALFCFYLSEDVLGGAIIVMYLITVSVGSILTLYRLYMVWWAYYRLRIIFVNETRPLKVFASVDRKNTRKVVTSEQSHLVPEMVKMLNMLQINKFKIQLAVALDIPLTFLNLWILWSVEIGLIQNPVYITSLCISVFSAGRVSTLIEYHLELRNRKKKLENLISIELWGNNEKGGRENMFIDVEGEMSPDDNEAAAGTTAPLG